MLKKNGGELSIYAELTRLSVCVPFRCVCACVRRKLLTQRATVPPTILSILYARLMSLYRVLIREIDENARVGGNA